MTITLDYPKWIYLICILVGVVFSFALYRKEKLFNSSLKGWFYTLITLRFLLGFILSFLLFNPLVSYQKKVVEKPILAILHDSSTSMLMDKDSIFIQTKFQNEFEEILDEFSSDYQIKYDWFGENILESDSIKYKEKITDISSGLQSVYDKNFNKNIAGIILLTDGIYNKGLDPNLLRKSNSAKIFPISFGDTLVKKDLILKEVNHNEITFLGNKFPIEISVNAINFSNNKVNVKLKYQDKVVAEVELEVLSEQAILEHVFLVEAKELGIQKFDVEITPLDGEKTLINNSKSIYIEVLNSKQKILLLANAPHPDLAAIKGALMTNENYDVSVVYQNDFELISDPFDVIVLHNITDKNSFKIKQSLSPKTALFFVLGTQVDFTEISNFEVGINLNIPKAYSEVSPALSKSFSLFGLTPELTNYLNDVPPLKTPFLTNYTINKQYVLAHQKVGSVTTKNPLFGFYENNQRKIGYLIGEGLWRWKMYDYQQNKTHSNFNDLVLKTVQYLSTKEDKSQFRVFTSKNTFSENEHIIIDAELYNDSYELTNESEVLLLLKNDKGETFNYIFSTLSKRYILNLKSLPAGNYTYEATTEYNSNKYQKSGAFSVTEIQNELLNTVADHSILNNLAKSSGGKILYPNQLELLIKVLKERENFPDQITYQNKTESILNLYWILFILIALPSFEWFIRKREGAY